MKSKMSRKRHPARPPKVRQGVRATHAALLALGQAVSIPAQAQTYVNYDGTRTNDEQAAVVSWANHPEFKADWGLGAMNAQYAYARGLSGSGVKLGAVDSGYLPTHQEFASRGFIALRVKGTYLNDGEQLDGSQLAWRAGEAFDRPGAYIDSTDPAKKIGANDNHGNHVSGTIAAAKNGQGMMGVSFGSQYYTTNSNGTDSSRYGSNMDYNYFKAAYGNLAAAGVRAINSSWGTPADADNYNTLPSFTRAYLRMNSAGKKTWLDAAADVSLQYGVLQVWANGNAGLQMPRHAPACPTSVPRSRNTGSRQRAFSSRATRVSTSAGWPSTGASPRPASASSAPTWPATTNTHCPAAHPCPRPM